MALYLGGLYLWPFMRGVFDAQFGSENNRLVLVLRVGLWRVLGNAAIRSTKGRARYSRNAPEETTRCQAR